MAPPRSLRISHVGLRGVVGPALSAARVLDFAAAFATFLDSEGPVVIGRDPRASGQMVRQGVIAALMACGHDVIDLGIVSTPVIQHAIRRRGAAGGISIGASHNSAEWNALKFFGRGGTYLSTAEAGELLDIYHLKSFRYQPYDKLGKLYTEQDAIDRYIEDLACAYDFASLSRLRVVVDCCNGTSSLILRRLNEQHGFRFILINERLEGTRFAHEPSTNAKVVGMQLAPLMLPLQADAGFLFDIDSDRVGIATNRGEAVSEEMVLPLLADHLLPRGEGKLVITNLSTTALVEEIAARHGGRVHRAPVGRQAAIDALSAYRPEEIALAGEGTGAVMMPRFRFVYDGIASMLSLLEMLHARQLTLAELIDSYPKYHMLKGEVPMASPRLPALLMELQHQFPNARKNVIDGLRVEWDQTWFHVRASQTEPVVRVICERKDEPPTALFEEIMERVRRLA